MHDMVASSGESSASSQAGSTDEFVSRHLGSNAGEISEMLATLGESSLDRFIDAAIPKRIRLERPLQISAGCSESTALTELAAIAAKNRVWKSYLGQGYHDTITPPVIQRNILENPGWYTAYTPYQAEISQGRLEALINFQQMIIDLTGLEVANASLLDEATAAAEAMHMAHAKHATGRAIFVSRACHPQTIAVVQTRAEPLGIAVIVGDETNVDFKADEESFFAVLLQYPDTFGAIRDYARVIEAAHSAGALVIMAADILALTLLTPPGELGADIAVGSTQRFGVPLGYGGPHAAYIAARDELKRLLPGRLVGVSKDAQGRPAYRLALQTREQHIRRDKATSNICTAQVLLAVMASMFAVYHGPAGLRRIARRIHHAAKTVAETLSAAGFTIASRDYFDTVGIECESAAHRTDIVKRAQEREINLRCVGERGLLISLDETIDAAAVTELISVFHERSADGDARPDFDGESAALSWPASLQRRSEFLSHPVFNRHHTETEMLRYIRRLEAKDLSLTTSMIALGSCTMKLNATSEMLPVTWPAFARMHPFAPEEQCAGYAELCASLENWLAEITGFAGVSLEPNAGSQGEYAGLLVIRRYHDARGDRGRDICLIPTSAHGTNPASAVMAGLKVVPVACLKDGDIDLEDLRAKATTHRDKLAALMLTYPSTHGVFEEGVTDMCQVIHECGGLVYMDGANMNAQVGLTSPGRIGADVCHLNLHKTFCIPHGGGGPGMGPIAVAERLVPFLPRKGNSSGEAAVGAISAAPRGSASILTIPWMYIRMMGANGLTDATRLAILNANYIARRLDPFFPVVFKGRNARVAHECIIDLRGFKSSTAEDVAKRLIDYGFHAPTLSWPVPNTLMIEPTESESKEELDRFCDALIAIHAEMTEVERGDLSKTDNPLKNAPHTATNIAAGDWPHPYSRERAAFPAPWLRDHKYWPPVSRIDNVYGDRNLFCACLPVA
jgi:glycine dehydrogenase